MPFRAQRFDFLCAAVLVLRGRRPDAARAFRRPAVSEVAPLGIGVNLTMMLFLPSETWLRLGAWLAVGLVISFAYGRRHSRIGGVPEGAAETASAPRPVLTPVEGDA